MSASQPDARVFAASGDVAEDEVAALERGLDALAFLERSRGLVAEPVEPPAGEPSRRDRLSTEAGGTLSDRSG